MKEFVDFLNCFVGQASRAKGGTKRGDIYGIELECEGKNVEWGGEEGILEDWSPHADGSLRNTHGASCEWVFNGPVNYDKSFERIDTLFSYLNKRKARLVLSNRTSTHVHFNMGDKAVYQFANLFILFTILEDILDKYCGEDREGNMFCLSSRYAEKQIDWISTALLKDHSLIGLKENGRYCSLNVASINKFGTVEFRAMRGLDNPEDLKRWLSILNELCEYACYSMGNPVEVVEAVSAKTPLGLLNDVFSEDSLKHLLYGRDIRDVETSIYEGVQLVQMLCYRIGAAFPGVRIRGKDFWENADKFSMRKAPKAYGNLEQMIQDQRNRFNQMMMEAFEQQPNQVFAPINEEPVGEDQEEPDDDLF